MMKRTIAIILAAACLLLAGCANGVGDNSNGQHSTIDMEKLRTDMLDAAGTMPEMQTYQSSDEDAEDQFLAISEDEEYNKVDSYFLVCSAEGEAYEIVVVAMKDAKDAGKMRSALEKHKKGRISFYSTYAPEQTERAEKAEVLISGKYVALIMCDNNSAVRKVFLEGVR